METAERLRAYANVAIEELSLAIRARDFKAFCRPFDPELSDGFSEEEFLAAIDEEQDGLGLLQKHTYLGQVIRNQDDYPGQIRFVYAGRFTQSEALIIVSLRESNGIPMVTEHVYYWD